MPQGSKIYSVQNSKLKGRESISQTVQSIQPDFMQNMFETPALSHPSKVLLKGFATLYKILSLHYAQTVLWLHFYSWEKIPLNLEMVPSSNFWPHYLNSGVKV